jgi:competence protein ComEC
LIHYWFRFKLSELLPGTVIALFVFVLFRFFSPLESSERVVWITEQWGDEKVATLLNKSRIPVEDDVEIGDIVDGTGEVIRKGDPFFYLLPNFRLRIYRELEKAISYPVSSVAGGVTLGVRKEIPDAIKSYFLLSGLYPFLAISGLHVGIVIGIIAFMLRMLSLKKPLTKASLVVLPLMPLTGLPPSAVRAYLFMFFVSLGVESFRKISPFYLLGVVFLFAAVTGNISIGTVLSFLAVGGILVVIDSVKSKALRILLFSIAPALFTVPVVLSNFGTFNLMSVVNSQIAGFVFVPFLIVTFLAEVTFFKVDFLNRMAEVLGSIFIQLSQEFFFFTKNFIFYSKVPTWISGTVLIVMLLILLSRKKLFSFLPPVFLLIYAFLLPVTVTNETFTVDGSRLNSFWFISTEGQSYRNCLIYSNYVFPYTKKCLYGNRLVDKRVIIRQTLKR